MMDRAFGSPAEEDRPPLKPRVTPRNRLQLPVPIFKLTRYGLWVMWSATTHQAAADAVNKAHKDWGNGSGEHAPPRVWREDARNNAGAFPKLGKKTVEERRSWIVFADDSFTELTVAEVSGELAQASLRVLAGPALKRDVLGLAVDAGVVELLLPDEVVAAMLSEWFQDSLGGGQEAPEASSLGPWLEERWGTGAWQFVDRGGAPDHSAYGWADEEMRRIVSGHAACCADRARGRRADQHLEQLRCAVAELAVPAAPYFPGGQEAQAEAQNQLGDALRRLGGGDPDKIAAAASAVIFRACAEPPPSAAAVAAAAAAAAAAGGDREMASASSQASAESTAAGDCRSLRRHHGRPRALPPGP